MGVSHDDLTTHWQWDGGAAYKVTGVIPSLRRGNLSIGRHDGLRQWDKSASDNDNQSPAVDRADIETSR